MALPQSRAIALVDELQALAQDIATLIQDLRSQPIDGDLLQVDALRVVEQTSAIGSSLISEVYDSAGDTPVRETPLEAGGGHRLVAVSPLDGLDLTAHAPQLGAYLRNRQVVVRVLDVPDPYIDERLRVLGGLIGTHMQLGPMMGVVLDLFKRAINRLPDVTRTVPAAREKRGLTAEQVARRLDISIEEYARFERSGRGLTDLQRHRLFRLLDIRPGRQRHDRIGAPHYAARPLHFIAESLNLSTEETIAQLQELQDDVGAALIRAGLVDRIWVETREDMQHRLSRFQNRNERARQALRRGRGRSYFKNGRRHHRSFDRDQSLEGDDGLASSDAELLQVWVSPDSLASQFFAGEWLSQFLAWQLRKLIGELAPDASIEILRDLHVYVPRSSPPRWHQFAFDILASINGRVISIETLSNKNEDARNQQLRRMRSLGRRFVSRDHRRNVVVISATTDKALLQQQSHMFGMTIVSLADAAQAIETAVRAALEAPADIELAVGDVEDPEDVQSFFDALEVPEDDDAGGK